MSNEFNKTLILELGDRVLRSWWTLVAGVCCGLAGGLVALHFMPEVYQATTKVWVNRQQIPDDVVRSSVRDDMSLRVLAFRDSVLEQPYMIELIERTIGLPETEPELTALINQVSSRVVVTPITNRRSGVSAFAMSYRDSDPRRAADIVNTLTRLFINQNSEFRKGLAETTADTIQRMAAKAKGEYDTVDKQYQDFVQQHPFETQDHLATNVRLLESRKSDLESLESRRTGVEDEVEKLEERIARARANVEMIDLSMTPGIVIDPLTQRIALLQRDLEELRVHYSERHPEVIRKTRELEEALAQARARPRARPADGEDENAVDAAPMDPAVAAIQAQIDDLNRQLVSMSSEESRLHRDVTEFERRIEVAPEVQRRLNELVEERQISQENWRKLERNAERARGGVDLEETDMADRMEALEYANVPGRPVEPDPIRVHAIFMALGCLLFLGPMLVRQAINPPISSEAGLRGICDVPVLVSVPRIATPLNRGSARRRLFKNLGLSVLSTGALAAVIVYLGNVA